MTFGRTSRAAATASVVDHASGAAPQSDPTLLHVSDWPVSTLKAPARTRKPEPARNPPATG